MEEEHINHKSAEEHPKSDSSKMVALAIIGIIVLTIVFAILFTQGKLF